MEDTPGIVSIIESLEQTERCPECGRPWIHDEPVHYADCRYYDAYDEQGEDDAEEAEEGLGWRSFRPAAR
ncbi:MAG TPA: hypothetical protein VL221_12030 [Bacteroidota bacterium]|nr:hypothetical protein [Bacteroidota bacterium]